MKGTVISAEKAREVMKGNLLGIELNVDTFGRVATLPQKYLKGDKTVIIPFFPELGGQIASKIHGVKTALEAISINVGNSTYIKISDYEKANAILDKYVDAVEVIVADKIIPNMAALKEDYVERAKKALIIEGVEGKDLQNAVNNMASKFPTRYNVDMRLNVYSFSAPETVPDGVSEDIAKLLNDGNNQKILSIWNAVVADVYQALFNSAAAVAKSMESNSGKVGSRTIGLVNTSSAKAKSFVTELGSGMAIGATEEAIRVFDHIFKDSLDSITPTTARMYAAVAYKEAKRLGAADNIVISDIGMDEETIEELDIEFADIY